MSSEDHAMDVRRLVSLASHPDAQTLREVHVQLIESRKRIQGKLSQESLSSYGRMNMGQLLAATELAIRRIDVKLGIDSGIAEPSAGSAGIILISEPTLIVAQHLEPWLPEQLRPEGRQKIMETLRQSYLGGVQIHQTIEQIHEALECEGIQDARALAQRIFRNVTGAIAAVANQAEMSSSSIPGLQKQWWVGPHCPVKAHYDLDGQHVPVGDTFAVGGDRMMFPHDPSASAANTEGCTCTAVSWTPIMEKFAPHAHSKKLS